MGKGVGISDRTGGKHRLLDKLLGRECGIAGRGSADFRNIRTYTFLDLCAGDGEDNIKSGTSSPGIFKSHQKHPNGLSYPDECSPRVQSRAVLIEKDQTTFDKLRNNFPDADCFNINALDIEDPGQVGIPNAYWEINNRESRQHVLFIHADPNHVEDWPINKRLLQNSPYYTTLLVTLGCNVGGLKRMPPESRKEWFNRMDSVLRWLPKRHDAILVALRGDASQWAYLIVGPRCWTEKYLQDANKAFLKSWEKGVDAVSYRKDPAGFNQLVKELFLTEREKGEGCQIIE